MNSVPVGEKCALTFLKIYLIVPRGLEQLYCDPLVHCLQQNHRFHQTSATSWNIPTVGLINGRLLTLARYVKKNLNPGSFATIFYSVVPMNIASSTPISGMPPPNLWKRYLCFAFLNSSSIILAAQRSQVSITLKTEHKQKNWLIQSIAWRRRFATSRSCWLELKRRRCKWTETTYFSKLPWNNFFWAGKTWIHVMLTWRQVSFPLSMDSAK